MPATNCIEELGGASARSRSKDQVATLGDLLDVHEQQRLSVHTTGKLTAAQIRRCLTPLSGQPIEDFAPFDLDEILADLRETAPAVAERTLIAIRQMFRWAVETGYADNDWGLYLQSKPVWRYGLSDRRVLSINELAEIYHTVGRLGFPFGPATRFLIVAMAPMQAVSAMLEEELDLGEPTPIWRPPFECKSTGTPFEVRLHALAEEEVCIALATKRRLLSPLVFSTTGRNQLSAWPHAKAKLDTMLSEGRQLRGAEDMPHWELRHIPLSFSRVVADLELDADEAVVHACLNRMPPSMRSGEATFEGLTERKAVLLKEWNFSLRTALQHYKKSLCIESSAMSVQ